MSEQAAPRTARRRLVLVTYFFPPEENAGARRPFQLRRYLPELGWDVRVVCPRLSSGGQREDSACLEVARGRVGEWLRTLVTADERPLFEQWSGASTQGHDQPGDSTRARALRAARGLLLPDEQAPWIGFALRAALRDPEVCSADVVLATAPPYSTHVAGALLARKLDVPLLVDYRDPYSLNSIYPPGALDRPLRERMERKVLAGARRVTAVSDGYARRQAEFGDCEVTAIRNGWEPSDGQAQREVNPPGRKDPLVLAHTGTVYPVAHDLDSLVGGIVAATGRGVALRIASCGTGGRFLREALEPHGLAAIVDDCGKVDRAEAVAMRAESSAQVLFLPSRPEDEGTIPSKVFDYIVSGRPVVAVGDPASEPGRILADAGAGTAVINAEQVADRLELLAAAQAAGTLAEHDVPEAGAAKYSGRAMAEKFAALLDEMLAS